MAYKYGKPITSDKVPKGRKRLPQYDECLREFLSSDSNFWEVNVDALPSKDIMVVLSSLNWRANKIAEFKGKLRVIMRDRKIYLEKVSS
jgi:hypothetical protein